MKNVDVSRFPNIFVQGKEYFHRMGPTLSYIKPLTVKLIPLVDGKTRFLPLVDQTKDKLVHFEV